MKSIVAQDINENHRALLSIDKLRHRYSYVRVQGVEELVGLPPHINSFLLEKAKDFQGTDPLTAIKLYYVLALRDSTEALDQYLGWLPTTEENSDDSQIGVMKAFASKMAISAKLRNLAEHHPRIAQLNKKYIREQTYLAIKNILKEDCLYKGQGKEIWLLGETTVDVFEEVLLYPARKGIVRINEWGAERLMCVLLSCPFEDKALVTFKKLSEFYSIKELPFGSLMGFSRWDQRRLIAAAGQMKNGHSDLYFSLERDFLKGSGWIPDIWYASRLADVGHILYFAEKYGASMAYFNQSNWNWVFQLDSEDRAWNYVYMAAMYSRNKMLDKAYSYLDKAIELKNVKLSMVFKDENFRNLWTDENFDKWAKHNVNNNFVIFADHQPGAVPRLFR